MNPDMTRPQQLNGKLGVISLAAVVFFTVSGGPYGVEPLIGYAGTYAIPLLIIIPLLYDIPAILVVLELNSMMPVEGGYYEWVKNGLGLKWAFFEGWWTWLYTFVDLAIYPVFFIEYASFFPQIESYKIPISLAMIWLNAGLNIRGIVPVGRTSLVLTAVVIIPFIIMIFTGIIHPVILPVSTHGGLTSPGLAIFTIMWNFIGWDNATTYANEVNKPVRSYVKAIFIAFGGIYIFYLLVIYFAVHSGVAASRLAENGFPYLGKIIGGKYLGTLLSIGGMAGMLGIFCAVLLSVSRVPAVMGRDNLLPKFFTRHHSKYKTPYISIILCAGIVSLLIFLPFADLIVMDICLYSCGVSLEFAALINLRRKAADTDRPFKIPLQRKGLMLLFMAPTTVFLFALGGVLTGSSANISAVLYAVVAILSAPLAWFLIQKNQSGRAKAT